MKSTVACVLVLLALSSCAGTLPPEPSGFLGDDYSALELDRETGNLLYVKEGADLSRYSKVMLDRVQVWVDTEDRYRGASWMDVRRVADLFGEAVRDALDDGYPIVEEPGPDVLRIRLAVTGVKADVEGYSTRENLGYGDPDTVDQVSAAGTQLDIETISVEAEFLDSATEERLVASVARRTTSHNRDETPWEAVRKVFRELAQRVRLALDGTRSAGS